MSWHTSVHSDLKRAHCKTGLLCRSFFALVWKRLANSLLATRLWRKRGLQSLCFWQSRARNATGRRWEVNSFVLHLICFCFEVLRFFGFDFHNEFIPKRMLITRKQRTHNQNQLNRRSSTSHGYSSTTGQTTKSFNFSQPKLRSLSSPKSLCIASAMLGSSATAALQLLHATHQLPHGCKRSAHGEDHGRTVPRGALTKGLVKLVVVELQVEEVVQAEALGNGRHTSTSSNSQHLQPRTLVWAKTPLVGLKWVGRPRLFTSFLFSSSLRFWTSFLFFSLTPACVFCSFLLFLSSTICTCKAAGPLPPERRLLNRQLMH